ncbi:MAG: hypothetical protein K2L18_07660, partial [Acetatifactor sp.]|nr:hypothetical protein [Acetatifactor sp.]
ENRNNYRYPPVSCAVVPPRGMGVYYVTYLPSMLLVGRCREEAVTGLAVLAVWCLAMQVVIRATWEKYSRRYDGVGI